MYIVAIVLVLFLGVILFEMFKKDKNTDITKTTEDITKSLRIAIFVLMLLSVLLMLTIMNWIPLNENFIKEKIPLFPTVGVCLASLFACYGVLLSVTNTHALEQKKSMQDKKYKILYTIDVMKAINVLVDQFCEEEEKVKVNFTDNAKETLQISLTRNSEMVKKLIESIFNKDILPYLEETQRDSITGFYIEFNDFYMRYILSPSDNRPIPEWNILSIDRYNHFNIFSNDYIIKNSSYTK